MKQKNKYFRKKYCYDVNVIEYAFYTGKGKAVMKKVNEVSKLVGVSRRTLQYYDDEGVFMTERSKNNHRLYDQEMLEKVWEIMVYKEMGFDLQEIKQLLSVSGDMQKEQLKLRTQEIEFEINVLKEQMQFILWVLENGIPDKPEEHTKITYKSRIEELRKEYGRNKKE